MVDVAPPRRAWPAAEEAVSAGRPRLARASLGPAVDVWPPRPARSAAEEEVAVGMPRSTSPTAEEAVGVGTRRHARPSSDWAVTPNPPLAFVGKFPAPVLLRPSGKRSSFRERRSRRRDGSC
ncbi:uncharacterized protein LOC124706750 [Lolium rigidum]|uniref:uncharacterized protein LOC124706750 n=1 Tax=Lolium rigidum TaxID=89674 RepID=UPI001F5D5631|nr:uncharacterized protein LOC124706750 [Lolium rigidum]